jgi:hypothetical protein
VFAPLYSSDEIGSLLTLPAGALPLLCPTNERAVLVLFPVSAWRVVFGFEIEPVGVDVCEPPQPARMHEVKRADQSRKEALKRYS